MICNRTERNVIQTHAVSWFRKQINCFPPKRFPKSEKQVLYNTHHETCTICHRVFVDACYKYTQVVLDATANHQAQALAGLDIQLHLQKTVQVIQRSRLVKDWMCGDLVEEAGYRPQSNGLPVASPLSPGKHRETVFNRR